MFPFQVIDTISNMTNFSDFINMRPENVFFKCLDTRSGTTKTTLLRLQPERLH